MRGAIWGAQCEGHYMRAAIFMCCASGPQFSLIYAPPLTLKQYGIEICQWSIQQHLKIEITRKFFNIVDVCFCMLRHKRWQQRRSSHQTSKVPKILCQKWANNICYFRIADLFPIHQLNFHHIKISISFVKNPVLHLAELKLTSLSACSMVKWWWWLNAGKRAQALSLIVQSLHTRLSMNLSI